jgi:hypothetical protein
VFVFRQLKGSFKVQSASSVAFVLVVAIGSTSINNKVLLPYIKGGRTKGRSSSIPVVNRKGESDKAHDHLDGRTLSSIFAMININNYTYKSEHRGYIECMRVPVSSITRQLCHTALFSSIRC